MARVFLILGGNLGDRFKYLEEARTLIEKSIGLLCSCSSYYETEPWGFTHENPFLNQALEVSTNLNPLEILNCIQSVETSLGRIRGMERYRARTIDIDILFYDDLVINTPELTIPHAEISKRRFVLEPMAEIASNFVHPVINKTIRMLLSECQDTGKVKKIM
jgi:2-amino-4-hydroxy-6-hydroxymethyldihydropteridine diphosphokinase